MLNAEIASVQEPLYTLGTTISRELAVFGSEVQLKTGLGMERIWRHFRPNTPKTMSQLTAILELEHLADRLDEVMWKSSLRIEEMIQIRERFASSLQLVKMQDVDAAELITVCDLHLYILRMLMYTEPSPCCSRIGRADRCGGCFNYPIFRR